MLVERRVVLARRQQHAGLLGPSRARRDRSERREERIGIILDRQDAVFREQFRKQPHHHLAVLQHVGDPGRRPRIVLEDVESGFVDTDDVDPGDVDVDVVRNAAPGHFRPVGGVAVDEVLGDDPGLQAVPRAVDVAQEGVQRRHALDEAAFEVAPFGPGQDAGNDVERDQPLRRVGLAIDREGDPDPAEEQFRLAPSQRELVRGCRVEPALQRGIAVPHRPVAARHLVERRRGRGRARVGSDQPHGLRLIHRPRHRVPVIPVGRRAFIAHPYRKPRAMETSWFRLDASPRGRPCKASCPPSMMPRPRPAHARRRGPALFVGLDARPRRSRR